MRFNANYKRDTRGWVYNVSSRVLGSFSAGIGGSRAWKVISRRAFLRKKKSGFEKFDSKWFNGRSIGSSINKKKIVDRWTSHIQRDIQVFDPSSKLTRTRGPPRPAGKLFLRIVTGISYRRGAQFTVVVHRYGVRSVAVERPPRKNDHRAPRTIRLMEKATAKDIDQFPEEGERD